MYFYLFRWWWWSSSSSSLSSSSSPPPPPPSSSTHGLLLHFPRSRCDTYENQRDNQSYSSPYEGREPYMTMIMIMIMIYTRSCHLLHFPRSRCDTYENQRDNHSYSGPHEGREPYILVLEIQGHGETKRACHKGRQENCCLGTKCFKCVGLNAGYRIWHQKLNGFTNCTSCHKYCSINLICRLWYTPVQKWWHFFNLKISNFDLKFIENLGLSNRTVGKYSFKISLKSTVALSTHWSLNPETSWFFDFKLEPTMLVTRQNMQ